MTELVLPVLEEIGPERCVVLAGNPGVLSRVPQGHARPSLGMRHYVFDRAAWRAEYRNCRRSWQASLAGLCRRRRLPRGAYELLAFDVLVASQQVAGCLEFLRAAQPEAIVTEYDRNALWSCLVLAARSLGIPTFTLVHGVWSDAALGYVPVLADRILCWGEAATPTHSGGRGRRRFVVAGCPRSPAIGGHAGPSPGAVGPAGGRRGDHVGHQPGQYSRPPEPGGIVLCGRGKTGRRSAVVRLHPSEKIETYEPVAKRNPRVRFLENRDATLDEALAAANIVVVSSSGLGSDALVKRRLTLILDRLPVPLGHSAELIREAGCPHVRTADELAAAAHRLLSDDAARRSQDSRAAQRYVAEFCAAFGKEAARRIASAVWEVVPPLSIAGVDRFIEQCDSSAKGRGS